MLFEQAYPAADYDWRYSFHHPYSFIHSLDSFRQLDCLTYFLFFPLSSSVTSCNILDHRQLRPSVSNFDLEQNYNFGISLFERLISLEFPYKQLEQQLRMRPEVSSLVEYFYPDLKNHPRVLVRIFASLLSFYFCLLTPLLILAFLGISECSWYHDQCLFLLPYYSRN